MVQGWPRAKMQDPIWKITKAKRTRGVAQALEHLPSKHEDLRLDPSTAKKNLLSYYRDARIDRWGWLN
jgi:hypothetical protein